MKREIALWYVGQMIIFHFSNRDVECRSLSNNQLIVYKNLT